MVALRKYQQYKEVALSAGIKILDIYRGRDGEVVRFLFRGRVYVVNIKGFRGNMKPEEFVELLKKAV